MKKVLFTLCVLVALVACSKDDDTNGFVPQSTERTVIVYMSGENDLSAYVNANLTEMKEGSKHIGKDDCLLVYVDKSKNSELPWLARIRDGQVTDSVSLADMGISQKNEYASDPHIMEDVLRYAVSHYPATRDYGLVLWGHSTGWLMADSIPYTRAYGVDNGINSATSNNGKWMNIPTLARVLQKLPHFKYIFADCCMFMCLESLYELRGVADYIIGSPAEVPQEGAPYNTVVPAMFDHDNFATKIVDNYYAQKNGPDKNLDLPLTVVKCSEMEPLAKATRTALQAVKAQQSTEYADLKDIIYYFYNDLKAFYKPENSIFHDAADFMRAKAPGAAYKEWKLALDRAVVKHTFSAHWYTYFKWDVFYGDNFTATPDRQGGVSMYVPQSPTTGSHATYLRDIQRLEWYLAVW
jgi:hypothetical protein